MQHILCVNRCCDNTNHRQLTLSLVDAGPATLFSRRPAKLVSDVGGSPTTVGVTLPRSGYNATGAVTAASVIAAACPAGTCAVGTLCLPMPFGGCGTGINYNTATRCIKAPNLIPIFYGTWTAAQTTMITNLLWGIGEC
jgi:hypothetical protein